VDTSKGAHAALQKAGTMSEWQVGCPDRMYQLGAADGRNHHAPKYRDGPYILGFMQTPYTCPRCGYLKNNIPAWMWEGNNPNNIQLVLYCQHCDLVLEIYDIP